MGLLSTGTPLTWSEARKYAHHVRMHGVRQFLVTYARNHGRCTAKCSDAAMGSPLPPDSESPSPDSPLPSGTPSSYTLRTRARGATLKWGDEVEYMLVEFDDASKRVRLSLRGGEVLDQLMQDEKDATSSGAKVRTLWRPEYARYMLEATPGKPYDLCVEHLLRVEQNMNLRRTQCAEILRPNEFLATLCSFPMLGAVSYDAKGNVISEPFFVSGSNSDDLVLPTPSDPGVAAPHSNSIYVPDVAINAHPRFATLTKNIRLRRTHKVAINVPVFRDTNTASPFVDGHVYPESQDAFKQRTEKMDGEYPFTYAPAKQDHIYMDAMCFGMGCCCLQVTLQASHICEARNLYDQLAVMTPILLALSAASPVFRGVLADVDCRWDVIAASVDDRSPYERALVSPPRPMLLDRYFEHPDDPEHGHFVPTSFTQRVIPKSRYDSISTYIAPQGESYNDLKLVIDDEILQTLLQEGIDMTLAKHIAHLFIRDPLVIYKELLNQDDNTSNDHFENIQSTNWQTMRFKPPPTTHPELGWRVEFRAMEVQPTDYENAAYAVFTVLLSRLILCLDLHLYLPLSLVDANMRTAQARDAITKGKFWFRKAYTKQSTETTPTTQKCPEEVAAAATAPGAHGGEKEKEKKKHCEKCNGCNGFAQRSSSYTSIESALLTSHNNHASEKEDWCLLSINDIINGSAETPGLVPVLREFLDSLEIPKDVRERVQGYLDLICARASGKVATAANWMRQNLMNHKAYRHDSLVTPEMTYDLLVALRELNKSQTYANVPPKYY